ncbi:MAG: flagellar protein, partial [Pseudomonadota bacterium]
MFTPVIPSTGLVGWRFLQRTYDTQFEAFSQSSQLTRATDYFAQNINGVSTAEDLVSDRRLLEVALGA